MFIDSPDLIFDSENYQKVKDIFVFVSEDTNGYQGVLGLPISNGTAPAVFGDEKTAMKYANTIKRVFNKFTLKEIKLIKFSNPTEIPI